MLERYGIKRIQPINEPFNPHLHQAVMEIQRTDVPAGTVVQVFQAGFTIEDRVLRPAMVAVAKGGPKPAQAPEAAQARLPRRRPTRTRRARQACKSQPCHYLRVPFRRRQQAECAMARNPRDFDDMPCF